MSFSLARTTIFEKLKNEPSPESIQSLERMDAFNTLVDKYEEFTDRTRSGEHGKTALFWMRYIDLVELYLLFSRACHTNDLELFIYTLGKMCSVFFGTNRPNYAR